MRLNGNDKLFISMAQWLIKVTRIKILSYRGNHQQCERTLPEALSVN